MTGLKTTQHEDFIYDIETYKNCFTVGFVHADTRTRWMFEVSPRVNQGPQLIQFLHWLRDMKARSVGFNNEGFDWVVLQRLMGLFEKNGQITSLDAYDVAQEIIQPRSHAIAHILVGFDCCNLWDAYTVSNFICDTKSAHQQMTDIHPIALQRIEKALVTKFDNRFALSIWPDQRIVTQVDLYKIHHFDNFSKSTSLKKIEVNQRSKNVKDLPYSPHTELTYDQADNLITYMCHDISETLKFYWHSIEQIMFRDELAMRWPALGDVVNFNDTKIGKKYFELELEKAHPGSCFEKVGRKKTKRQTIRSTINLADAVSPKVIFREPAFEAIRQRFLTSIIVETKGVFDDMVAHVGGLDFVFGVGGMHGSIKAASVYPDDEYDLVDVDVASYYPNLFITLGVHPAHLPPEFCEIYRDVYQMRLDVGKKTLEGGMLKLALNGTYGATGDKHSPFFDQLTMMQITINGQLFLCMLAEWVIGQGCQMVQINTDGITVRVPKSRRQDFNTVCKQWENHTGLELEHVEYSAMHIRDVNSYMAVKKKDGSVKRIGAYCHETPVENPATRELMWHKNHNCRIVAMAAEAKLIRGVDIAEFITNHRDPFDFMLSTKVPRSSHLEERWADGSVVRVQNITRFYASTQGCALVKVMPPDAKSKGAPRPFAVMKGWTVRTCNDVDEFDWSNVNWLYYIEEAKKITSWVS